MNKDNLATLRASVLADAKAGRFCRMFDTLDNLVAAKPVWADRCRNLRTQYDALCSYALDGAPDPARSRMRADIAAEAVELADNALHASRIADSPQLYYSKLRYEQLQPESLEELMTRFRDYNSTLSLALLSGSSDAKTAAGESVRLLSEALATRIFNRIWTNPAMSREDFDAAEAFLNDDAVPESTKEQVVWALMLGGTEYFQQSRLTVLGRLYSRASRPRVRLAALMAFLILLWNHRMVPAGMKLTGTFDVMRGRNSWASDVRTVAMELVRTRDTERISQKLKSELFPAMMKLRPGLEKLGDLSKEMDMADFEANPEWEELLDKSGLTDKLKELSELQSEGADLMMATFSPLKNFPFFNEVSNWFLPYNADRTEVAPMLKGNLATVGELIASSPALCDSDKYSMILSLDRIPAMQRNMFAEQIKAHDINAAEMRAGSTDVSDAAGVAIVRVLVQNLYRFFKLFRRKSEFTDPFATTPDLSSLAVLGDVLGDADNLRLVAEFYFKRGYYAEAAGHFNTLLAREPENSQLLQKAGYCSAATGDLQKAVELYSRAEYYVPDSLWTLRKLASTYRLLGDYKKALEYYRKVEAARPDDLNVAYYIGHCLLETGDYEGALKKYFKVEYLEPSAGKSWRPIAWCSFLSGDYARSKNYYDKILASSPTASDYLNAGHLAMAESRFRDAVELYGSSLSSAGREDFERMFEADVPALLKAGVDPVMIEIVTDKVN
jgi:tetratricopeptide (TPR) repeat protein